MFSARYNPWMAAVETMAEAIRPGRQPLPKDNPSMAVEREAFERIGSRLGALRQARDHAFAAVFKAMFVPGAGFSVRDKD